MTPTVSCLMPTYGRRRFVAQAVAYFLAQDHPSRELVVVDDGPEPVADLLPADDRVRYVRPDRRMTIGAKRNLACTVAAGDVLVQWDDDDWYGPARLRLQSAAILAGRADITFLPQAWLLDVRSGRWWHTDQPVGAGATFAFSREAWRRTGGYEDSSAGEDWRFFHRVLEAGGRSAPLPDTDAYVYVRHAANAYRLDFDPHDGPGPAWRAVGVPAFVGPADAAFYRALLAPPGAARVGDVRAPAAGPRPGPAASLAPGSAAPPAPGPAVSLAPRGSASAPPPRLEPAAPPAPGPAVSLAPRGSASAPPPRLEPAAPPAPGPAAPPASRPPFRTATAAPVPLAFVHHANQHLVTDGYADREGISELVAAFSHVLEAHVRHRVPMHLHLSGTLVEALAWHHPQFLARVRALRSEGLVELLGSAYAQNPMAVSSPEHNRRQLAEALAVYRRHLGGDLPAIRGFWVPERIWDTAALAPAVADPALANGGYGYVLLDDRLALPADERPGFDATTPGASRHPSPPPAELAARTTRPFAVASPGAPGLVAVPVSARLRWAVPPGEEADWAGVEAVLRQIDLQGPGSGALAVYADDLEKTARTGPWAPAPWDPARAAAYEHLLDWVRRSDVTPVLLSPWLAAHPPAPARPVDPGTYYELAHVMGAGDDYRRWWDAPAWAPSRRLLEEAEAQLARAAAAGHAAAGLRELAWKQLMACSYEAGWHVPGPGPGDPYRPARWIRAAASHARTVAVVAEAARRSTSTTAMATATVRDVDGDGHDEVVLANDHLLAVVTPRWGARLVLLFHLTPPGALVVGTPADDWHLQEDPNRALDAPRTHLGAFADAGHEHDPWLVASLSEDPHGAAVTLAGEAGTKTFRLGAADHHLDVAYDLARPARHAVVDSALSPDYLALLREGRASLSPIVGGRRRGWRNGAVAAWLELALGAAAVEWEDPWSTSASHAMVVRLRAAAGRFSVRLGVGP